MSASSGKLIDQIHVDLAVLPKSLATASETGAYFSMAGFGKAVFLFTAATIAATKTVVAQVMKAKDAAGGSAAELAGATATITANTAVKKALLTANTIADGDSVVTINGVTFTCEDTTPDIDAGEFGSGDNDTEACANLAAAINHLLGDTVLAEASTTTVILTAKEPGEATITITDADATIVPSTLEAQGKIEVDLADLAPDFTHLALKLTTDATIVVSATLLRSEGRYSPKR